MIADESLSGSPLTERADVGLHALSQLPQRFSLIAAVDGGAGERLRLVAAAYGIADRLELEPAPSSASGWRIAEAGSAGETVPDMSEPAVNSFAQLIEVLRGDGPGAAETMRGDDSVLAGARVAVVSNIPTHYRVPLWNLVAERLERVDASLIVLFTGSGRRPERPWLHDDSMRFEHRLVDEEGDGLARELRRFAPSLIVSGGFAPAATGRALWTAERLGIPFGIWSGDTLRQPTAHSRLRRVVRRWVSARSTFGMAYGWLAAEYLRELNPDLPVVICRNSTPAEPPVAPPADDERTRFLTVGQAIPRKRLDLAIEGLLGAEAENCTLTVIGDGPELPRLRALAGGDSRIELLGAMPFDQVRAHYRDADCFLFPSASDVFGLVLVEAMGSGLATVTASDPASVADLGVDGRNCLIADSQDPAAWAQAVQRLAYKPQTRTRLAAAGARTVAERWTIEHSADAWVAGFRLGLTQSQDR